MLDPDLVPGIEALLQLHRVPADRLTLEITEGSVLGDPHRTGEVLQRLHELAVRLSIDDFGTGYPSLSYLRQLPVQSWDRLRELGCRMVQGYHLSRPLPLAEFGTWLRSRVGVPTT